MIMVNKYNYINNIEKKTIVIQAFTIFINEKLEYRKMEDILVIYIIKKISKNYKRLGRHYV